MLDPGIPVAARDLVHNVSDRYALFVRGEGSSLWDADGQPIDGAGPVTLRGDMNHAGMKPVLADATGTGGGQYTADFEWTMAGDWTVAIEATLPDGRVKRATFPFTVEAVE